MKEIKILGTGCPKCKATFKIVEEVSTANGFSGTIEKVEDIATIISYGIMSTPAVIIDGQIAFAGGVPSKQQVESWFTSSTCSCCSPHS